MNEMISTNKLSNKFTRVALLVLLFSLLLAPVSIQANVIPDTGYATYEAKVADSASLLPLDTFVEYLTNGEEGQIVGVYVEDAFAQKVVQQPEDDAAYVSPFNNQITDFGMVSQMTGNIGLLAHNYLSGELFFDLVKGDVIHVVYGDGSIKSFSVDRVESYQALSPHSVYSDFVNLDTEEKLSATQLFENVYGGSYHMTFQTCIREGDEYSWGRLFVIATPLDVQS
jgi:hypothetical protein